VKEFVTKSVRVHMTIERWWESLGHLEIEKATFRSLLCCERPFRSCTI